MKSHPIITSVTTLCLSYSVNNIHNQASLKEYLRCYSLMNELARLVHKIENQQQLYKVSKLVK